LTGQREPTARKKEVRQQNAGHIYLHAQCPCGFERKLSPGSALGAGGYTIAYNADESDLLTEKDETIKLQGLRTVDDPFLSLHENFEEKLSLTRLQSRLFDDV
jgi:hypothetical protein